MLTRTSPVLSLHMADEFNKIDYIESISYELMDLLYDSPTNQVENHPDISYSEEYIYEAIEGLELEQAFKYLMETLTERESTVITMRFGLFGGKPHTLQEIADDFNVSRERIRQLEAKTLRKLRHPARAEWLIYFIPKNIAVRGLFKKRRMPVDSSKELTQKKAERIIDDYRKRVDKEKRAERKLKAEKKQKEYEEFYYWYQAQTKEIIDTLNPSIPAKYFEGTCNCRAWAFHYHTNLNSFLIGCLKCLTKFEMK